MSRQPSTSAIEELLLPWQVDVALHPEISQDLEAHLQRVGRCIWRRS